MSKKTITLIIIAVLVVALIAEIIIVKNHTSNKNVQKLKTIKVNEVTCSVFYTLQSVIKDNFIVIVVNL